MSYQLGSNTIFKIRRKSDGKIYHSHPFGAGCFSGSQGGFVGQSGSEMNRIMGNIERNLDCLQPGDCEVVEFRITEVTREYDEMLPLS
jgi:hypothetical protein